MKKLFLPLAFLFSQAIAQTPQRNYLDDPSLPAHEHALDFTRLRLELWPDPVGRKITGKVTHYFRLLRPEVDSFFLDGILLDVKSVTLNGQPVHYRVDSAGITIRLATPLTWDAPHSGVAKGSLADEDRLADEDSVTIEYSATPRHGLYFIGWDDPRNLSRKQIWSQGEATDNRWWIPLYDEPNDKVVSEVIVHFDKTYNVLSNGVLASAVENADGTKTWDYQMSHPQAPYLIMLAIGKYAIKETHSASGVPMHLFYYPEWPDRVAPTYHYSEAMMDFFEREIGLEFPWEGYSVIPVQDYMYGAMENTTATIYGDFYMADRRGALDRSFVGVNAHELAHQWFGDYVTARSDAHGWLQESFATYYSQLFDREVYGEDYFQWERRNSGNAALEESKRNLYGVANSESGSVRVYGKGAFVLDMLKYVVGGREAYNKAIGHYLSRHPYGNVDTHQLLVDMEESTGMDLQWFWDEWLDRGGEPEYQLALEDHPDQSSLVISQHALPGGITGYKDGLFKMPVVIELHYTDHSVSRGTFWLEQATQVIELPKTPGATLAYVLFDPGSQILKSVAFPKPPAMLLAQAVDAPAMLDRYDALVGLRQVPLAQKREVLQETFKHGRFFALRNEALGQLAADGGGANDGAGGLNGGAGGSSGVALIGEALGDTDVAVRKGALALVDPHGPLVTVLLPALTALLHDSSYELVETSLQKLADARPDNVRDYLQATRGVNGVLGSNVRVRWLELAYLAYGKKVYADELVAMTSVSYEFRTRDNAMAALRRLDYFDRPLVGYLVSAILNSNTRLSGPAGDLLAYFYAQDKYKRVIGEYIRAGQWKGWQWALLSRFGG
jgi:Peptidase family M1 domain/Peptidase M1 N-terminal domain